MAYMSSVTFTGHTLIKDNYANGEGGAVNVMFRVKLKFSGVTVFSNNTATLAGGAMFAVVQVELVMTGNVTFENNKCMSGDGGAISIARSSRIILANRVSFVSNWAVNGGAMYLRDSTMTLKKHAIIFTSQNHAEIHGGGIFYEDKIDPFQCNFSVGSEKPTANLIHNMPNCWLQLENFKFSKTNASQYEIISYYNSAGRPWTVHVWRSPGQVFYS